MFLPLFIFSMYFSSHLNFPQMLLEVLFLNYVIRLHMIRISWWRYKRRKKHERGTNKKDLKM